MRQTVLIYNYVNSGPSDTAHFSTILAENIGIEVKRTGYYTVRRNSSAPGRDMVSSREYLKGAAESNNVDYVVTGIYSVEDGVISVSSYVYIAEADEVKRIITPSEKVGVFVDQLVDSISVKISFELQKYLIRMSDPPVISPYIRDFKYYHEISLKTEIPGAQLYYTTDGTTPSRKNGIKYTGPFNIYKSSTVNAVAVKENWPASNIASRKYEQDARISLLEGKALYGVMQYISNNDGVDSFGTAQVFSAVPVIYFGGINGVKTVPFVRDLGIGGFFDFGNTPLKTDYTNLLRGYSGGLFYKLRFHRHFRAELPFTYGMMNIAVGDKSGAHVFSSPNDEFPEKSYSYMNTGLLFNIRFGFIEFDLGPMFKYIMTDDPTQIVTYYGGIGINF